MDAKIGSLVAGKKADIIGFKLKENKDPDEAPFMADHVDWMMIEGRITTSLYGGTAEFSGPSSQ